MAAAMKRWMRPLQEYLKYSKRQGQTLVINDISPSFIGPGFSTIAIGEDSQRRFPDIFRSSRVERTKRDVMIIRKVASEFQTPSLNTRLHGFEQANQHARVFYRSIICLRLSHECPVSRPSSRWDGVPISEVRFPHNVMHQCASPVCQLALSSTCPKNENTDLFARFLVKLFN